MRRQDGVRGKMQHKISYCYKINTAGFYALKVKKLEHLPLESEALAPEQGFWNYLSFGGPGNITKP